MSMFADTFTVMMKRCHTISRTNGFYDDGEPNHGERIALMHSELSEALEALRKGNPPDDKIPQLSAVEVELADVIIRIMDYAAAQGFCLAEAIEAKCAYNETRSYKHGKAF